jgi:hypothetical protein
MFPSERRNSELQYTDRLRGVEIAIARLAKTMGALGAKNLGAETGEEKNSGEQGEALEHALQALQALQTRVQQLETAGGTAAAMACQTITAVVTADMEVLDNTTGVWADDIKLPEGSGKHRLPAGKRVRLIFPQFVADDESIYMGTMWVDPDNMEVSTGWARVYDGPKQRSTVCDFTV